jgi:hypothetical protein
MPKPPKEKTVRDWDRRPWPAHGDADAAIIYCHVGRFLSLWEKLEAALAFLFATFSGPYPMSEPARRSFFAVRTFEGRAEMLKAASAAFFHTVDEPELQDECKSLIASALNYSPRRNDIARGFVDWFATENEWNSLGAVNNHNTYSLYPSIASFKERDIFGRPSYCLTSAELEFFYSKVILLQPEAHKLADNIAKIKRPPFPGIYVRQRLG